MESSIKKINISVIIPSYNCGTYVNRAIDSVLRQTLKGIEIIIVNDASTDNTSDVLLKYLGNKQIKILTNRENQMLGSSRNLGLSVAKGEYVFFLDADDWIDDDTLRSLFSVAEEGEAEIIACGARKVFEDGRVEFYHGHSFVSGGGKEALIRYSKHEIGSIVWNKLYLREFINKNALGFISKYWFEDVIFTLQAIFVCNKYISVSDVYCNYFQRSESYTNSKPSLLNLKSNINVYLEMLKFFKHNHICDGESGRLLCLNLLRSHCSNDVFPKMIGYIKAYPGEEWKKHCQQVCADILGVDGYAVADFIIYSLDKINDFDLVKIELGSVLNILDSTKLQLSSTIAELNTYKTILDVKASELNQIYCSRAWRLVIYIRKIFNLFFPKESIRRKIIATLFTISKRCIKGFIKIKEVISSFFLLKKNFFIKYKANNKRKINRKSKKIVYIGHSYHNKTRSTSFLLDYLREFYEVEIILDRSWLGESFPDLSFIDESYFAVIFFQQLPPQNILDNIKNKNILFFPMYDEAMNSISDYHGSYKNLKIINFSRTLHNRFEKYNLKSIYIQYFPKPGLFTPGNINEVFFWQRHTHININTICTLFNSEITKIHLHKAVDPYHNFIEPTADVNLKFKISYSDWFESKDDLLNIIKQKSIYIAPREYEGIGMSFLEAMAMGKAVIAIDKPTMNEYITNGETGYLFDLNNPKEIDLRNLRKIQKNSHEYIKKGYELWKKDRKKIIDFIEK